MTVFNSRQFFRRGLTTTELDSGGPVTVTLAEEVADASEPEGQTLVLVRGAADEFRQFLALSPKAIASFYQNAGQATHLESLAVRGATVELIAVADLDDSLQLSAPYSRVLVGRGTLTFDRGTGVPYPLQTAESGLTAARPALPNAAWPAGRMYFDTTLGTNGMPIFVGKTGALWVDAAGATV